MLDSSDSTVLNWILVLSVCPSSSWTWFSQPSQREAELICLLKSNEISVGMWAWVKNGKYKGDLTQFINVGTMITPTMYARRPQISEQSYPSFRSSCGICSQTFYPLSVGFLPSNKIHTLTLYFFGILM
ncbi:hypothetical protein K1719_002542 [Acacia pycnantha]|nr:hypothetical protein K1719_002542 [Acacia pycnantha]